MPTTGARAAGGWPWWPTMGRRRPCWPSFSARVLEPLARTAGLRIRTVLPGPQGGDVQIGAEVAAGEIDALIFLRDPLTAKPHEPDIAALLRVADVHNVALATNLASAECLVRALTPEGALAGRG